MSNQHDAQVEYGGSRKSLPSYVTGFVLSILLTLIAFALVEKHLLTNTYIYAALSVLAVVQLIVQAVCFLRLNSSEEGKWNLLPFLFSLLIIAIFASGTLWIMNNLNYNMFN